MSTMNVTEYKMQIRDGAYNAAPAAEQPALASENVTFTTSTASSAFNASTTLVRVYVDADAYIKFGTSPIAAAGDVEFLPAGTTEYFGVVEGQSYQVAAVEA